MASDDGPKFTSEEAVLEHVGIPSFKNLSASSLARLLDIVPDVDRDVALAIFAKNAQEIALAAGVIESGKQSFGDTLRSIFHSRGMAYEIRIQRLQILRDELSKGNLTEKQWNRVLDDVAQVDAREGKTHEGDRELIAEIFKESVRAVGLVAAAVATGVIATNEANKKKAKKKQGLGRFFG